MNLFKEKNNFKYFLFIICYCLIVVPIVINIIPNYVAMGGDDAITQHYSAMLYTSRVIKDFFSCLFSERQFVYPMYEWTLGMGENTIATLNWYGFNDPFYLLSIFFAEEHMPYFYTLLFYFRVFLGGLASIVLFYEINEKKSNTAYVVAALVYTFTGFTLQCNIHIIFTHAMMYIPMMFLGTERVIKGKKSGMLLLTVFAFAFSGFFYLYIASISIAVYTIYRTLTLKNKFKKIVSIVKILLFEYFLGLGLAAVIFVPEIMGFLSSSRGKISAVKDFLMSWDSIKKVLLNLLFPNTNNTQVLSVSAIAIVVILWVILSKGNKVKKITLLLFFISIIIPFVAWIMSGFSKIYDRWHIVIILYISYLVIEVWDDIQNSSLLQKIGLSLMGIFLVILGKYQNLFDNYRYYINVKSYLIILFFIVVLFSLAKKINKNHFSMFINCIFFSIVIWTISLGWNEIDRDTEASILAEENIVKELVPEENRFYRIDYEKTFGEPRLGMNLSFVLGYMGISEYFSIENNNYVEAFAEWEAHRATFNNGGFDQRTILETTAAVKYFIVRKQNSFISPYGFYKINESQDGIWEIYENKYALPIVYAYDNIIDKKIYDEMDGLNKQQVLLQAASMENYTGSIDEISNIKNSLTIGKYEINDLQGGTIQDGVVSVQAGAIMNIVADLKANCENYLYFKDDLKLQVNMQENYLKNKEPITLGQVSQDESQKIEIKFLKTATFDVDTMQIIQYNFDGYEKYINNMKDGIIDDSIVLSTNRLECKVNFDEGKILCVAAPYCKGWSAFVDGKKQNIHKINSMYMGIEVFKGEHTIVLQYITPGIKLGSVISVVTLIIMFGAFINHFKHKYVIMRYTKS